MREGIYKYMFIHVPFISASFLPPSLPPPQVERLQEEKMSLRKRVVELQLAKGGGVLREDGRGEEEGGGEEADGGMLVAADSQATLSRLTAQVHVHMYAPHITCISGCTYTLVM